MNGHTRHLHARGGWRCRLSAIPSLTGALLLFLNKEAVQQQNTFFLCVCVCVYYWEVGHIGNRHLAFLIAGQQGRCWEVK